MDPKFFLAKYLTPGDIWKAVQTFTSGQPPKEKYLILVSREPSLIFYLMPTSKGKYLRSHSGRSYVTISVGSYSFFPLETYIDCDRVYSDPVERFKTLAEKKKVKYIGRLSEETMEVIREKLRNSRVLARMEKDRLFPKR